MSVTITNVSNITVLVSYNVTIWFGNVLPMSHSVKKDSSQTPPTTTLTRFSQGLFVVLQEILYRPCFALIKLFAKDNVLNKDNTKIRYLQKMYKTFFLSAHCWPGLILLFCHSW